MKSVVRLSSLMPYSSFRISTALLIIVAESFLASSVEGFEDSAVIENVAVSGATSLEADADTETVEITLFPVRDEHPERIRTSTNSAVSIIVLLFIFFSPLFQGDASGA